MLVVFEDETMVTQKPCIRKSMSFEGEQQQKIRHIGGRKKFSMYISMLWPEQKLLYDFYMTNQILPMRYTILRISRYM